MCSDAKELSHFCAIYSAIGALFQLWVGIMILKQPFYISGLKDVENCKQSAFGAMVLFVIVFFVSICYLCFDNTCNRSRYGELETTDHSERSSLPPGMTDYEVNMELSGSIDSLSNNGRVPYSDDPPVPFSDDPPGTVSAASNDPASATHDPFSDESPSASSHGGGTSNNLTAQPPDLLS
uniref:Uncharacterized protein n=1 Tax=Odontella aurita TaxID=265563 RepID=A0A7S4JA43_9STRA|mmetsp:Transcript_42381/g.128565  ORF Transcript_42381/g.128565 Transcript_42381/m.128565 type:complete len:180 (+) Transcript_42381:217-756(+)|eukprot:CAMPEP_0113530326 /NCGR_PEP_ID=MMETSP0015_2-20120614/2875_1 /TAXON_ID=2838 /ORGANISM="Odontella" /LENGTH=179 /DNA_ID=CAMNT_0000429031 /DNA_START=204 /DNA_END=746 /DNA_ORIENTATION=+ /assembly_acc=CAM_ASM_000160